MTPNPCRDPEIDPNDWFISKDGRQYADEPWISREDREKLSAAMAEQGLTHIQQIAGLARAEASIKRDALIRRRKAREACMGCPVRLACLEGALERREQSGTWGGVFEEDIRKIGNANRRRKKVA